MTGMVKTKLTGGALSIELQEGAITETTALVLSLTGWDEATNLQIETAPKLFGKGSYIRSMRQTERSLTLEVFVSPNHTVSAGAFLNGIREVAESMTELTIRRTYLSESVAQKTERLSGFVTGLDSVQLYLDGSVRLSLSILCPNPQKTITLPEPEGGASNGA